MYGAGEGYRGVGMQRGKVVEHDLFSEVKAPRALSNAEKRYMKFGESLAWAKEHQPGEPTNPRAPFANEVRIEILDLLALETPEEFAKVRFYTAVGSHLDYFHGTDAFIEFDGDAKKNIPAGLVTLGVTIRNKEGESLKTDIEIWAPNDGIDETGKDFSTYAKKVAVAIVAKLRGAQGGIVDLHRVH
jgi:hypothetical protein